MIHRESSKGISPSPQVAEGRKVRLTDKNIKAMEEESNAEE
jgi:hypothetical protein